jgi:hypothetical protein
MGKQSKRIRSTCVQCSLSFYSITEQKWCRSCFKNVQKRQREDMETLKREIVVAGKVWKHCADCLKASIRPDFCYNCYFKINLAQLRPFEGSIKLQDGDKS